LSGVVCSDLVMGEGGESVSGAGPVGKALAVTITRGCDKR